MKNIFKSTVAVALFTLFTSSNAFAGFGFGGGGFSFPLEPGSTATVNLNGGRSYTCQVFGEGDYTLSLNVQSPQGETLRAIYPIATQSELSQNFRQASSFGDVDLSNNSISFSTPEGEGAFGNYTFTLEGVAEESRFPFLECFDTSLTCSFNTAVNTFNFLEITNLNSSTAVISYTATNFNGESVSRSGFVPAGRRGDFDIHSIVGESQFGTLVIKPLIFVNTRASFSLGSSTRARLSQYDSNLGLSNVETCSPLPFFFVETEDDGDDFAEE